MATLRPHDFDGHFRKQYPILVNELDFILGDRDLARDIAQEAFARQFMSWARLSHFDKPGAWVRKVAIRLARKTFFRREQPTEVLPEGATSEPDVARVMDVRQALQQLSNQQRTAVVLHYYSDLPVADVAKSLGCTEATAKVHLFQARKRLFELLSHYGPENS